MRVNEAFAEYQRLHGLYLAECFKQPFSEAATKKWNETRENLQTELVSVREKLETCEKEIGCTN